jgi:para-nitrobenzyl esterase
MYVFTHESDRVIPNTNHTFGAAHAGEIVYKFNNVQPAGTGRSGQQPTGGGTFADSRPERVRTARNMSEFWSTFARTAAQGQPAWPAYTTEQRATMFIDAQCRVVNDPFSLERRIWDSI